MSTKKTLSRRLTLLVTAVVALAILGSLAAETGSRGQEEAHKMELLSVQQAVSLILADNNITLLPNPVTLPTTDMSSLPDALTSSKAKGLLADDKAGYLLRGHDKTADGDLEPVVDYIDSLETRWAYTVDQDGRVTQSDPTQE